MGRGGKRAGAGRKAGSKNKRTKALERAQKKAAKKIEGALGDKAFHGDAHALLMAVYKDGDQELEMRLDAAAKAIRFEKPSLAQVEQNRTGPPTIIREQLGLPVPKPGDVKRLPKPVDKPELKVAAGSATTVDN